MDHVTTIVAVLGVTGFMAAWILGIFRTAVTDMQKDLHALEVQLARIDSRLAAIEERQRDDGR